MKKLFLFVFILSLFIGCSKTEDDVITSISFDKTEMTLKVGETKPLKVIYKPSNLPTPVFSGKYEKGGIIDYHDGKVTALKVGEEILTFSTSDQKLSTSCHITVISE